MDDITLARALHVLAVIHWIGGLSFVTLILLPLARSTPTADEALALFASMERRFSAQVRISIPLAGASGLWMTWRWNLWDRFHDPHFWWMTAMLGLWLIFMVMLFVIEPLSHASFEKRARKDPAAIFRRMNRLHQILLMLTAFTALGAVAGAHGCFSSDAEPFAPELTVMQRVPLKHNDLGSRWPCGAAAFVPSSWARRFGRSQPLRSGCRSSPARLRSRRPSRP